MSVPHSTCLVLGSISIDKLRPEFRARLTALHLQATEICAEAWASDLGWMDETRFIEHYSDKEECEYIPPFLSAAEWMEEYHEDNEYEPSIVGEEWDGVRIEYDTQDDVLVVLSSPFVQMLPKSTDVGDDLLDPARRILPLSAVEEPGEWSYCVHPLWFDPAVLADDSANSRSCRP